MRAKVLALHQEISNSVEFDFKSSLGRKELLIMVHHLIVHSIRYLKQFLLQVNDFKTHLDALRSYVECREQSRHKLEDMLSLYKEESVRLQMLQAPSEVPPEVVQEPADSMEAPKETPNNQENQQKVEEVKVEVEKEEDEEQGVVEKMWKYAKSIVSLNKSEGKTVKKRRRAEIDDSVASVVISQTRQRKKTERPEYEYSEENFTEDGNDSIEAQEPAEVTTVEDD